MRVSADFPLEPLECPVCGEDYLHQRDADVHCDDSVDIRFWCEGCHGWQPHKPKSELFTLNIRQHEGVTFVRWLLPKSVTAKEQLR